MSVIRMCVICVRWERRKKKKITEHQPEIWVKYQANERKKRGQSENKFIEFNLVSDYTNERELWDLNDGEMFISSLQFQLIELHFVEYKERKKCGISYVNSKWSRNQSGKKKSNRFWPQCTRHIPDLIKLLRWFLMLFLRASARLQQLCELWYRKK